VRNTGAHGYLLRDATAFERNFLQNRVAHQRAALDMAGMCIEKAIHEELKQFCSVLRGADMKESEQLQSWLAQWYGTTMLPRGPEAALQGLRSFLDSVQKSTGAEFEEAFLRTFRLHNRDGISESQACESTALHQELRAFCAKITIGQQRETKQINTWICHWFRDCVEK
jgi:uncharacterized protein (DUF305 family)